jgi:hypothetical protein
MERLAGLVCIVDLSLSSTGGVHMHTRAPEVRCVAVWGRRVAVERRRMAVGRRRLAVERGRML